MRSHAAVTRLAHRCWHRPCPLQAAGVPTVPGSEGLIKNSEDAVQVRLAVLMQQDWCRWLLPQRGLVVWA